MKKKSKSIFIIFSFLLTILHVHGWTKETEPFTKVDIEEAFHGILTSDPEFMKEGGARLIARQDGRMALIGIGKVFPERVNPELMPEIRRKGEIKARTAILELGESVEISTSRESKEKMMYDRHSTHNISLSYFFQTTETRVVGLIKQMPIIGTWWSGGGGTYYVAVGKTMTDKNMNKEPDRQIQTDNEPYNMYLLEGGEEPFLSLLKNSPSLCKNGGVRGLILEDNRKILIAVNSAIIQYSLTVARKIEQKEIIKISLADAEKTALEWARKDARRKAIRSLLGHRNGIQILSLESLVDKEYLLISGEKEQRIMLSRFLSIQEEQVSGFIHALPIVAEWQDAGRQILFVALGTALEKIEN